MTVLVTGAAGFLGQELVGALRTALPTERIIGADLSGSDATLDVTDAAATQSLVSEACPRLILHAAALTPGGATDTPETARILAVNLGGTLSVLSAAANFGTPRLLLLSSGGVYARGTFAPRREDAPLDTSGPYAASKRAAEIAALSLAPAIDIRIARPGPLFGPTEARRPSRPGLSLVARMAEAARSGMPLSLAAPDAARDWTLAADAATMITRLALAETLPERIFNISAGRPVTNAALASAFAPHGLTVRWENRAPDPTEEPRAPLDPGALTRAIGPLPNTPLDAGIAALMAPAHV